MEIISSDEKISPKVRIVERRGGSAEIGNPRPT
jgi:hypothetical protein